MVENFEFKSMHLNFKSKGLQAMGMNIEQVKQNRMYQFQK